MYECIHVYVCMYVVYVCRGVSMCGCIVYSYACVCANIPNTLVTIEVIGS